MSARSSTDRASARPGMVWILVGVAVLVALGAGVGLGAVLFGDDNGDGAGDGGAASPTTSGTGPSTTADGSATTLPELPATTVAEAGLSGDALELAEAINRAHQLTYHVLLQSVGPETSPTEVELWRRLPLARRDTRIGTPPEQLVTSEFRSPEDGHVGCLVDQTGSGQTTCVEAPPGNVDPADPVIGVVDPTAGTVTASNDLVQGIAVRCFTVAVSEAGSVVNHVACFDQDGIPAVLDGGDGRLERVGDVERGVADDVFVQPEGSFIPDQSDSDSGSGSGSGSG